MDFAFATFLGIISGIVVGAFPGISTSTFLLLSFPFLVQQSFLFCIIFYATILSVSQYFGSVTTLSFGVPGETTSFPLLEVRDDIIRSNSINQVHFLCAYGSLIAFFLSSTFLIFTIDFFSQIIFYLKSYISLTFAIVGIILCIFYSSNTKIISIIFVFFAWLCGKVGYDPIYNDSFLTFNNVYLYAGIPTLPAILGIYAIPNLLKMTREIKKIACHVERYNHKFEKIRLSLNYTLTIFRSSTIGFFCGLVPYVGSGMSSYIAFLIEKKANPKDFIAHAIASESSNNSANFSVLIPLLFLGIAIIPSEFILIEIISSTNKSVIWKSIYENFFIIIGWVFVANVISFIFSWNLINVVNKAIIKLKTFFPVLIMCFIFWNIYLLGVDSSQEVYYISILLIFSFFGILLNRYDLLPFVYVFLLQNTLDQIIYRICQIYF